MTKSEIFARVRDILEESFELDSAAIVPQAHLVNDLDLDSIDAIDLAVGLQSEVGLDVAEEELQAIRVVEDIVNLVYSKVGTAQ
jgi:acyl carrier protein